MNSDDRDYFDSELGDSQAIIPASQDSNISRRFLPLIRLPDVAPLPPTAQRSQTVVPPSQPSTMILPKQKAPRLPEWEQRDLKILVAAKKTEWDTIDNTKDVQKKMVSSVGKWKKIVEFCLRHGVTNPVRDGVSCKKRWESLSTMWRKVFDYEENIPSGKKSYFAMTTINRREQGLPLNFDRELYALIIEWYPEREDIMPKDSVLMDTIRVNQELHKLHISKGKAAEKETAKGKAVEKETTTEDEDGPIDLEDYENEEDDPVGETPDDMAWVDASGKENIPPPSKTAHSSSNLLGETPDDVPLVDASGSEIPPASKATKSKSGDDFEGAEKRPTFRGRKRKFPEKDREKEKEPSMSTTAHGLLEHLKQDGLRREKENREEKERRDKENERLEKKNDRMASSLEKLAESSAIGGRSMQAVADALLALVAQQAAMHK